MLVLDGCNKYIIKNIIDKVSPYFKDYLNDTEYSLKDVLNNRTFHGNQGSKGGEFSFNILKEDYYIASLCDFSLFFSRAFMQRAIYKKCGTRLSPSWAFVTLYYMGFFSATALLRIFPFTSCYVYIDSKLSANLSSILTLYQNEKIYLHKGNYTIKARSNNKDDVILDIKSTKLGAHELTWNLLRDVIKINEKNCNGYEKEFYKEILKYMQSEIYPPSILRNYINYDSKITIKEIINEFQFFHNLDTSNENIEDMLINEISTPNKNLELIAGIFFDFLYRYVVNIYDYLIIQDNSHDKLLNKLKYFNKKYLN